jgi:hypothetical protein
VDATAAVSLARNPRGIGKFPLLTEYRSRGSSSYWMRRAVTTKQEDEDYPLKWTEELVSRGTCAQSSIDSLPYFYMTILSREYFPTF